MTYEQALNLVQENETLKICRCYQRREYGKKAYVKEVENGKWYNFSYLPKRNQYGKVVEIIDDTDEDGYKCCLCEKTFDIEEKPYWFKGYYGEETKWYEKLPMAI